MWAFGIELVDKNIEALLQPQAVEVWLPCGFSLEGQMHAFVPVFFIHSFAIKDTQSVRSVSL